MADLTYIRVEHDAEIAVVSIDRQDKLNVLNAEVVAELGQVFESLRKDDSVRGVIVTGAGEKAFVAGADIGELAKMDSISGVRVSRDGQDVFMVIERFPKPVLAAVGGFALGGGLRTRLGVPPPHRERERPLRSTRSWSRYHSRLRRDDPAIPPRGSWPGDRTHAHRRDGRRRTRRADWTRVRRRAP